MAIKLVVIAHDIRSAHNVGSIFRTCEGLGAAKLFLSGYTPYPLKDSDDRLPHIAEKANAAISKTALGAQNHLNWERSENITELINRLKSFGYQVVGLEQTKRSIDLKKFSPGQNITLILGNEVTGIPKNVLKQADKIIEIPLRGKKESLNVAQACAIAVYTIISKQC